MQNNKGQKRSIGSLLSLIFVLAVVAAIAIYFLVVLIRAASGAGTVSEYLNNLMPNVVRTRREFWKSLKRPACARSRYSAPRRSCAPG